MNDCQIRIAEDGEIQVKGPVVFKEYYRNPQATSEVFTKDGWFCTGDIGEFTNRGFLKITDRKKELIVTSGGKKIAPQKLENLLKSSRFISNGLVFGDKQKYLVALVTLNEPEVRGWAQAQAIGANDFETLTKDDRINHLIEAEIKGMNDQLASFESIKKFRILPHDFTVENGELTPSLKVKRRYCVEKYKDYLTSMY
jgi:long-chain acyl-CoA synthetase